METPELLMLVGTGLFTAALLGLVFMLGQWRGERRAARDHVDELAEQRAALAEQRRHLGEQRLQLDVQRIALEGRRAEPLPDTGRAHVRPRMHQDEQPTVQIPRPRYPSPNKRHHRRYDDGEQ